MTDASRKAVCCAVVVALSSASTAAQDTLTRAQYERMVREHKERAMRSLDSELAEARYSALSDLGACAELPADAASRAIGYLADFRGPYPGNTVAGAAAELLAQHPEHARRAIPQLLTLLGHKGQYGFPSASAARALRAIERRDLERHVARLGPGDRRALAARLAAVIHGDVRNVQVSTLVCEILCMLGRDASGALDALRATNTSAREGEKDNRRLTSVRLRSDSALKIIQAGWTLDDPQYVAEMRRVDAALGRQDAYVRPEDRFSVEWHGLLALMKSAGVGTGYVIRHDQQFPFEARTGGLPLARLIQEDGYSFLHEGLDLQGRVLPQKPMILLTSVAKRVYAGALDPSVNPRYAPLTQDFVTIEIGVNGRRPLGEFFGTLGIAEGYDDEVLYVFWPRAWWQGASKILPRPNPRVEQLQWLKIANGKLVAARASE